jgi:DNA polymerase-4
VKTTARRRSILHVDLDPFFVSVERALDPSLRGRPLVVGGSADSVGVVAAASAEAQAAGVKAGQSLVAARRLCPGAVFRSGDLATYARVTGEVTAILLAASRRVEQPSADEAYVDLTPEAPPFSNPAGAVEGIKDELQRRLGLDASFGLASSRLAARVASRWARPRGFLVVLPGYESSFLAQQPVSVLSDLPAHLESALIRAGIETLGQLQVAEPAALTAIVGEPAASRLQAAARDEGEAEVAVTAPPAWVQEEAAIRDRRSDRAALQDVVEGLARRAARRLRPFGLGTELLSVEVQRPAGAQRRSESLRPAVVDEDTIAAVLRSLSAPLLDPPQSVRGVLVRLGRLVHPMAQAPLFPLSPENGARARR